MPINYDPSRDWDHLMNQEEQARRAAWDAVNRTACDLGESLAEMAQIFPDIAPKSFVAPLAMKLWIATQAIEWFEGSYKEFRQHIRDSLMHGFTARKEQIEADIQAEIEESQRAEAEYEEWVQQQAQFQADLFSALVQAGAQPIDLPEPQEGNDHE